MAAMLSLASGVEGGEARHAGLAAPAQVPDVVENAPAEVLRDGGEAVLQAHPTPTLSKEDQGTIKGR